MLVERRQRLGGIYMSEVGPGVSAEVPTTVSMISHPQQGTIDMYGAYKPATSPIRSSIVILLGDHRRVVASGDPSLTVVMDNSVTARIPQLGSQIGSDIRSTTRGTGHVFAVEV